MTDKKPRGCLSTPRGCGQTWFRAEPREVYETPPGLSRVAEDGVAHRVTVRVT